MHSCMHAHCFKSMCTHTHTHTLIYTHSWQSASLMCILQVTLRWSQDQSPTWCSSQWLLSSPLEASWSVHIRRVAKPFFKHTGTQSQTKKHDPLPMASDRAKNVIVKQITACNLLHVLCFCVVSVLLFIGSSSPYLGGKRKVENLDIKRCFILCCSCAPEGHAPAPAITNPTGFQLAAAEKAR